MKKMVQRMLGGIIIIVMLLSLCFNYFLQVGEAEKDMDIASQELFWQINQILLQNNAELNRVKNEFREECLLRARTAAYIIQCRPSVLDDPKELKKIISFLQVDELHVFDTKGMIYAGSEPKYYGYSFDSGEQMHFFSPMLQNHNLELCQDITPNTAEGKLMQYAAVWQENEKGIVQIGMEPARVLETTKRNELSYIFSLLTADKGTTLYAIDSESYEILGSTYSDSVGRSVIELGLQPEKLAMNGKGFYAKVNGQLSYCVFSEFDSVDRKSVV